MDPYTYHCPRANVSQLILRTLEQLEEPKYATVPQTHWDEMRPSILTKYNCNDDKDAGSCGTPLCLSLSTTEHSKPSCKCSSPPVAIRALNWNTEPLWRYCASKIYLQFESGTRHVVSAVKAKQRKAQPRDEKLTFPQTSCSDATSFVVDEEHVSISKKYEPKWKSHGVEHVLSYEKLHESKVSGADLDKPDMQRSEPAFELLPPLFENCTHSLLYQNSYLLDGVKYDYDKVKAYQQRNYGVKLKLNYLKFLKSVNKSHKPSDRDIVFGEAKLVTNPPRARWEGSRIDWLLNLEHKQELRRQQSGEEQMQMQTPKLRAKIKSSKNEEKKIKSKSEQQNQAQKSKQSKPNQLKKKETNLMETKKSLNLTKCKRFFGKSKKSLEKQQLRKTM